MNIRVITKNLYPVMNATRLFVSSSISSKSPMIETVVVVYLVLLLISLALGWVYAWIVGIMKFL